jgi:TolA-binding protein
MKSVIKWIVAMMAVAMVVACGQPDTATSAKEELTSSAADIKQTSKKLAGDIQDYSMEQKGALQKQVQGQIDNLSGKIDHLQDKSENATAEAKASLNEATADLTQKLETAKGHMRQLQSATADTWEDVKGNLSAAMLEVEEAYNKAASRLQ